MSPNTPPIADADYRRIFQVIYSILESEKASTAHACTFFSIAGATILNQHYKIKATPLAGAALYVVDETTQTILAFASRDPAEPLSTANAFHSWVKCGDFVIDFMAPIFHESMPTPNPIIIPRRVFKKHISTMSNNHEELRHAGDFLLVPDQALSRHVVDSFFQKQAHSDLLDICLKWYKRPPFKISTSIQVGDQNGTIKPVRLLQIPISGSW